MSVIMPGSYDPVTSGHVEIIRQVAKREDEVYAVIFINPDKEYTFSLEDRVAMLMLALDDLDNVIVSYSLGYVVDYMREHEIEKIIKGYRNDTDLEYERAQAEWNYSHGGYETILWKCDEAYSNISSTVAREAISNGGNLLDYLHPAVAEYIKDLAKKP